MVPFGGWEMPVQYTGIVEEHRTVRGAVGCFDVSHMGEFEVEGPGALAALQRLTTNDVAALEVGQVQYSAALLPDGGIVDDSPSTAWPPTATCSRSTPATSTRTGRGSPSTPGTSDARWRNVSEDTGLIAVQGPKAEALVGRLADRRRARRSATTASRAARSPACPR